MTRDDIGGTTPEPEPEPEPEPTIPDPGEPGARAGAGTP